MAWGYVVLAAIAAVLGWLWLQTGNNSLRLEALRRFAIGIPFFIFAFILGSLFGVYTVAVWLADVTWQFLTGREGFDSGGHADRLWDYKDQNTRYVMTGEGSPRWFP